MKIYSVKQASEITGIPERTIHYTCKRDKVYKKSNRYQITDELINLWVQNNKLSQLPRNKKDIAKTIEENETLKQRIKELEQEPDPNNIFYDELSQIDVLLKKYKIIDDTDETETAGGEFISVNGLTKFLEETNSKQLDVEVESLKIEIETLKEELSQYDIAENEQIEVFTNEEYNLFETRLIEWRTQQQEIEHKDKILELTTKGKDEQIAFFQNQLEYQRSLANKQLEQLETIFEILQGQNRTIHQLNFINAKDKGYDKPK